MRRVQEYKEGDAEKVQKIMDLLSEARKLANEARCPKLSEKIRLALSSAAGASRNVWTRKFHRDLAQQQVHHDA